MDEGKRGPCPGLSSQESWSSELKGTHPPRAYPASRPHTRSPESRGSLSKQPLSPLPGHARTSALDPPFRGKTAHLGSPFPLEGQPSNGYSQGRSEGCSGVWAEGSPWVLLRRDWGWEEERAAVGWYLALPILPPARAPHLPRHSDGALIKGKE